jgi:hypothetical protein
MENPLTIHATVAAARPIDGDPYGQAVLSFQLDGDHAQDWSASGLDLPGFAFAVNVHGDIAAEYDPGMRVTITVAGA